MAKKVSVPSNAPPSDITNPSGWKSQSKMFKKIESSLVWSILLLITVIGIAELLIMFGLHRLALPHVSEMIVDSLVLAAVISPVIYLYVTEGKRMQQKLAQRVEELQTAYQELKELDKMKDSFLSTVSHELRTPLTSIKGFTEILLGYEEEDKDTQREFLGIINEETEHLTRLLNNFLDLSKIQGGQMQWEDIELEILAVIQTAVTATQPLATQKNLGVDVDLDRNLPTIWGDKDRVVQVVTNLLNNAVKFTPEGGEIRVRAQVIKDSESKGAPEMIKVSVSDSGIGIAPGDYEKVFDKFSQGGDTLTDKPEGTGLGLPICKEIVEHYGGRIWVESEPGKGSTFLFILPILEKAKGANGIVPFSVS